MFQTSNIKSKNKGFTLIELLISIGIIVVLASISFVSLLGYKQRQSLVSATQEIVAVVRNAQDRSISQEGGSRWGVHFENPLGASAFYDLFQGLSYASGTVVSRSVLPSGLQFDSPAHDSSSTIIFSPISGLPNSSTDIKISLINNLISSSTITVSINGEIHY